MKEEHIWTKKPETMLDWFCVVGACIALYLALNNLGYFLGKIGVFIGIVSPFAGGIVIAYVLDPMVKFFYTKLFKEKKKTRGFAILLAYLVAILLLVLLAWLVLPQIVDSIASLFTNFPSYIQSVQDMLGMNNGFRPRFLRRYADLHTVMTDAISHYISDVKNLDFPNEKEQY